MIPPQVREEGHVVLGPLLWVSNEPEGRGGSKTHLYRSRHHGIFYKLRSSPNAKTAQAHVVVDLTEIDPEALLRKITEKEEHLPEDLAFIWFSPPCETNSSMQRANESRDAAESPVTWHHRHGGEAREGPPGDLARKHDILVLKWVQWLTSQWGQSNPVSSRARTPSRPASCPTHTAGSGSHILFF